MSIERPGNMIEIIMGRREMKQADERCIQHTSNDNAHNVLVTLIGNYHVQQSAVGQHFRIGENVRAFRPLPVPVSMQSYLSFIGLVSSSFSSLHIYISLTYHAFIPLFSVFPLVCLEVLFLGCFRSILQSA